MANSQQTKQKSSIVPIITMFFLFAMISFVTNLAAPVGTIWKGQYSWAGMMGNLMNFAAYLFMGIPAGNLLSRIGYKRTALAAMAVGVVGLGLQYISSFVGADTTVFSIAEGPVMLNFIIYLLGAFVSGFCVCMLNTVVNPMLNLMGGGGKKGNTLLQLGNSCNSLAGTLTPLLVGMLVGQVTAETAMADVSMLLLIAMGVFVLSFIIISMVAIPEPAKSVKTKKKDAHSPLSFRHTVLGVIGIFFYVGIEVGIPSVLIFYLSNPAASGIMVNGVAVATSVAAIYWFLMLVGRLSSSVISMWVSSRVQLIVATGCCIILILLAILIPDSQSVSMPAYSVEDGFTTAAVPLPALWLVLCGLFTSVMWGSIFNLAVEGLGKYTPKASGLFMMMVVGGGVMPWIQEKIAGDDSYLASYWLVVAMLAYLLFYALIGSKNVNRDIPVDDDVQNAV